MSSYRACINNTDCSAEQRRAATLQYIEAAYGPDIAVSIAALPPIEERWWRNSDAATDALLSEARSLFFQRNGITDATYCDETGSFFSCSDQDWFSLKKYSNASLGSGTVLLGAHDCGKRFGQLYQTIEREVAENPEEWIFLLEHHDDEAFQCLPRSNEGVEESAETILLTQLAEALNIPVRNAVLQPSDPLVLKEMEQRHGIARQQFAVEMMILGAGEYLLKRKSEGAQPPDNLILRPDVIIIFAEPFAAMFNVNQEEIQRDYQNELSVPPGAETHQFMDQRFQKAAECLNKYVHIANDLSPPHVRETIRQSGKQKALLVMGAAHAILAERVYQK